MKKKKKCFDLFIVSRNVTPNAAMSILYFHMWNYKSTLKFSAKIKGKLATRDIKVEKSNDNVLSVSNALVYWFQKLEKVFTNFLVRICLNRGFFRAIIDSFWFTV